MKKVELLAPAGGFEELIAAIKAGADSVYVGAKEFSARAYAKNFSEDELKKAIDFCHERGKKIYLAINTLIYNDEMRKALKLLEFAYKEGIDAVIVQDIGLLFIMINEFPDLPIYASTQMTVHNLAQVKFLEGLGVKRVILSRELSIDEIKNIRQQSSIELEVFVHGALCVSYSGQCLFSSIIFKRSGNRGQCAQPCRLYYKLLDKEKKVIDRGYLLSPKDICLLENIDKLIEAGVDSFKIEGRLKDHYYVYTVSSIYRKYIDMYYEKGEITIDSADKQKLLLVFNRGNFSTGYLENTDIDRIIFKKAPNNTGLFIGKFYFENETLFLQTSYNLSNGDVISFRNKNFEEILLEINNNIIKKDDKRFEVKVDFERKKRLKEFSQGQVFIVRNKEHEIRIEKEMNKEKKFRKVDFKVWIEKEKKIKALAACDRFEVVEEGEVVQQAKEKKVTSAAVISSFSKLGGTIFEMGNFDAHIEDGCFVKVSELNRLRKVLIEKLSQKIISFYKRSLKQDVEISRYLEDGCARSFNRSHRFSFMIDSLWQLEKLKKWCEARNLSNYEIYIPYNVIFDIKTDDNMVAYLDRITHDEDLKKVDVEKIKEKGIKKVLVRNLGQYEIFKHNFEIYFDFSLNTTNSVSLKFLELLGGKRICLSVELSKTRIIEIYKNAQESEIEVIVFGRIPLMINRLKFFEKGEYLQDRNGELLKLIKTQRGKNEVLNPAFLYIDDKDVPSDVLRFDFTGINEKEMEKALEGYFDNKGIGLKITKGYYLS
ncbi:putative protease [Caldicellulosiruptor bescii]|uniref:Peptidase U32 n=2 Tax=Caldicellulosiruptor bescii TaxID=31899 RepID=B9MNM9_CALBD|nr:U32 family peptidase [Caldicellulosiruptor bescii]ACM59558.1 peptidase U32 [Caldicellulosiruptor bescii DSM 6725]PBC89586.1 putative protease [Caldicellulosiruptor bescii]PBC89909.1 putative protease [Caldicellulosiruptor bescii]PBD04664.1 putative protease [Caldicellulosiruptor bescii]PBD05705.1 putative protease [Caldicellulosiruptor bescii]